MGEREGRGTACGAGEGVPSSWSKMDASDTASVGIQPTPHLVAGTLEPVIEVMVLQWVIPTLIMIDR